MAHRAGTGDAPIPGLVTSRRNPAYRLKARPKAQEAPPPANSNNKATQLAKETHSRRRSPSRDRGRRPSPKRDPEGERRSRERREEEDRARQEQQENDEKERQQRRAEEEEMQKKRWAEQEARWTEERRQRDAQRKVEEQRQVQRQQKLKGAFATDLDEDDEEDKERARELAEKQRRKAAATAASAPVLLAPVDTPAPSRPPLALTDGTASLRLARPMLDDNGDPVRLRASLADPAAVRTFAPGEVAEHFRRLAEMKRRFRRAEFGGPDRSRREPSRSRSREKYNSVWIRPGGGDPEPKPGRRDERSSGSTSWRG